MKKKILRTSLVALLSLCAVLPACAQEKATLWSGGYEKSPASLTIGYVNKQWISSLPEGNRRENMFLEEGKRLHGFQLGLGIHPSFDFGIGVRTGLYYEMYLSESPAVKDMGWDKFTEHDMYIPAQLTFRIPFSKDCDITFSGGIGFQWAIYGRYREWNRYIEWNGIPIYYYGDQAKQQYGDGWPRHVNWQAEGGVNLRIKMVTVGFTYSYGLTDHEFYAGYKTRQDKMAINVGVTIPGGK